MLARLGDAEPPVLTEMGRMAAEAEYYPHPLAADVALGALTNASSGAYLAYGGSLTAPACDEAVTWAVLTDAVAVTAATLDRLKAAPLRPDSALTLGTSGTFRPLQPRGGREVWSSAGDARACPAAGARDPAECERTDEEAEGAEEDDPTEVIVYIFMTLALGVLVQFTLDRLPPPLQFPYTVVIFLLGFALEAWSQGNGHVARYAFVLLCCGGALQNGAVVLGCPLPPPCLPCPDRALYRCLAPPPPLRFRRPEARTIVRSPTAPCNPCPTKGCTLNKPDVLSGRRLRCERMLFMLECLGIVMAHVLKIYCRLLAALDARVACLVHANVRVPPP